MFGDDPKTGLKKAIERDDVTALRRLVRKRRTKLNKELGKAPPLPTPLGLAIGFAHTEVLRVLCENGADVNQRIGPSLALFSPTPLVFATSTGGTEMVRILCAHGAEVNGGAECEYNVTPLHIAAEKGNLEMLQVLCFHGANVNRVYSGSTALTKVLGRGYSGGTNRAEIVHWLCEQGADVNYRSALAVRSSCRIGDVEVLRELLQRDCDVNLADRDGNTILHVACRLGFRPGNPELVWLLLAQPDCDVNLQNNKKQTPLQYAIEDRRVKVFGDLERSLEIIMMLVKTGSSVEAKTGFESPLTAFLRRVPSWSKEALRRRRVQELLCECVQLFIAAGSAVGDRQRELINSTVLHSLLSSGGILQYVEDRRSQPSSLQDFCRLVIRSSVRKPLTANLRLTGLPQALQNHVLLEII